MGDASPGVSKRGTSGEGAGGAAGASQTAERKRIQRQTVDKADGRELLRSLPAFENGAAAALSITARAAETLSAEEAGGFGADPLLPPRERRWGSLLSGHYDGPV